MQRGIAEIESSAESADAFNTSSLRIHGIVQHRLQVMYPVLTAAIFDALEWY